jgi:hypothetical protein
MTELVDLGLLQSALLLQTGFGQPWQTLRADCDSSYGVRYEMLEFPLSRNIKRCVQCHKYSTPHYNIYKITLLRVKVVYVTIEGALLDAFHLPN